MRFIKPCTSIIALSLLTLGGCGSAQSTRRQEKTIMTEQSNQADDNAIRAVLARSDPGPAVRKPLRESVRPFCWKEMP